MGRYLISLIVCLLINCFAAAQEALGPKVEAISIEIRKSPFKVSSSDFQLQVQVPPGQDPAPSVPETLLPEGTMIGLKVSVPKKHMIRIDFASSKFTSLTDDKATDFGDFGFWYWRSEPGFVFARSKGFPGKGATKIKLKGEIVVLCATEEKILEIKDVVFDLDPKKETPVGPFVLKYEGMKIARGTGQPMPGDGRPIFSLGSKDETKVVTRCECFVPAEMDRKGEKISDARQARIWGERSTTPYGVSFVLDDSFRSCTISVKYFNKVESVKVPVDMEVGLGW